MGKDQYYFWGISKDDEELPEGCVTCKLSSTAKIILIIGGKTFEADLDLEDDSCVLDLVRAARNGQNPLDYLRRFAECGWIEANRLRIPHQIS